MVNAIQGRDGSELNDDQKREKIKEASKMYSEALIKKESELTDNIQANIGLMNLTDYCDSFESNGTYNCDTSRYNDSLDETKNEDFGVTWLTPRTEWKINNDYEWLMSYNRLEQDYRGDRSMSWAIINSGEVDGYAYITASCFSRPVFFLTSDIELSGEGTIENPFRVAGIE